ncbi:thiol reductant ABC exporter subunit CydC [Atopobacter phocae]|uniref:thiol reductant ABC exporter subunit CydC n=1 Tax=Atopobacter phocae TaxID=136492 RepID=UPI00047089C2|nr:thiol reductant ABC exporter subunit CydC [Atopobacter phocae]
MKQIKLFQTLSEDSWVRPFLAKYRRPLFVAIFLGVCTFICATSLMFTSGYLISKSATRPENILLIYIPIVMTRAFGIGRPVFRYFERLVSHNWVLKMTSKLRLRLYRLLEIDAIFFKHNHQTGDMLGLLSEDINHIQNLYLRTIFPTLVAWSVYVLIVIFLGFFSIPFALLMGLMLLMLMVVLPIWSIVVNGARQEQEKQIKRQLYTDLTDNVLGVSDWIFSGQTDNYLNYHQHSAKALNDVQMELNAINRKRVFIGELWFGLIALLTLIWAGLTFGGQAGGAANWIAAFVLAVFPLIDAYLPLSLAAEETNRYNDSLVHLNRLSEGKDDILDNQARELTHETLIALQGPLTVEVKELVFGYDNQRLLDDLSITLHPGEKIALLGRSGSGKSTLASILRGDLKPLSGEVTINQVPVHMLGDGIAHYIGFIEQNPHLFHTTIANNLRLARADATTTEMWDVLERVGLKQLVESLDDGLETLVGESGTRFSGGERHRLALARVLLQQSPIIILDEPTVGLDPYTEQQLLKTFFEVLENKTVLWITHHLQGIVHMDQVLFIESGHITINGTPAELSQTHPHYQRLLEMDRGIY